MGIIEVIPSAVIGALTVKGREGSLNGETTWRCEDEKGRNIVFLESEIIAQCGETVEAPPELESETDSENADEEVMGPEENPVTEPEAGPDETIETEPKEEGTEEIVTVPENEDNVDEVPGGATVAQSEPEQEKEEVKEEKPEPEKKNPFSAKKIKRNKEEITDGNK